MTSTGLVEIPIEAQELPRRWVVVTIYCDPTGVQVAHNSTATAQEIR